MRKKLVAFLDTFLKIDAIKDACWNGLQFEGTPEVKKVAVAVDAGNQIFEKAAEIKADMLIVHHGHFWTKINPALAGWAKKRIDLLYKHNISLYAAHLPLDRHPDVGNNAQLIKLLGATIDQEFSMTLGKNIGWTATFEKPIALTTIEELLNKKLPTQCVVVPLGKKDVASLAVCSGGGNYADFYEAVEKNVDLYITGDTIDIYQTARDVGINVIFAGHNATERLGVKALAYVVQEKFEIETEFIDIPTGL